MSFRIMDRVLGRTLIFVGLSILVALFSFQAFAQDKGMSIVDVRRNIPLSDTEPVYKDFYINAGLEAGLKKNQTLTVFRRMSVRDAAGTTTVGEMEIPVATLKIIASYNKISVARETKLISREQEPMLEQIGIQNGDTVAKSQ